MPPIGLSSTLAVILVGAVALGTQAAELSGVLFLAPFSLGPLFVSAGLALPWWRRRRAQSVLAVGTAAYALFFAFCFLSAFHWHPDPQSPIVMVFVGSYSLPVMLIFWIVAWKRVRTVEPASDSDTVL